MTSLTVPIGVPYIPGTVAAMGASAAPDGAILDAGQMPEFPLDSVQSVFSRLTPDEMPPFLANVFSILPHRGCIQQCSGCHSGALPSISTATWADVVLAVAALQYSSELYSVGFQQDHPKALVETFRDSDSAHLAFASGQGVGDFARLVHEKLGRRAKVMTAGVRYERVGDQVRLPLSELDQLALAASHSRKLSVSVSVQTRWFRELGPKPCAQLLARTIEACLADATQGNQVYLDMMCFTDEDNPPDKLFADNTHPATVAVRNLFLATIAEIDARYLSDGEKNYLRDSLRGVDAEGKPIAGRSFHKIELPGRAVGYWVAPYLGTGRAADARKSGVALTETDTTDWFPVLRGDGNDRIGIRAGGRSISATRLELKDWERRHKFVEALRNIRGDGLLAERAELSGNWFSFFRSEIDLSPTAAGELSAALIRMAPGSNHGATVNLLLTDLIGGEWQVVIPFKRLNLR